MTTFDFTAGIDAVHSLPAGQGIKSHAIDGFAVYLLPDAGPLFRLAVEPLFDPDRVPGHAMIWNAIPKAAVVTILTAITEFSIRHFADNANAEIAGLGSELVADVERFLSGN